MKKSTLVLVVLVPVVSLIVTSCGKPSGSAAAPAAAVAPTTQAAAPSYTMVVATEAELPACAAANAKQLVYVTESTTFKSCEQGAWTAISIKGKDGAAGLTITSNTLLNPYNTNICTTYASIEECYFTGGQLVKFSDNTILLTGTYAYDSFVPAASNGNSDDYDRLANSISLMIPPSVTAAYQRLDWSVSRGSVNLKGLYLVYYRATDVAKIIFDTNANGTPDTGDEVVHTVVKSSW
jgi:hypothetical protein